MRAWLSEMREGFRQLCSREFWDAFRDYYSTEKIKARLDAFAEKARKL